MRRDVAPLPQFFRKLWHYSRSDRCPLQGRTFPCSVLQFCKNSSKFLSARNDVMVPAAGARRNSVRFHRLVHATPAIKEKPTMFRRLPSGRNSTETYIPTPSTEGPRVSAASAPTKMLSAMNHRSLFRLSSRSCNRRRREWSNGWSRRDGRNRSAKDRPAQKRRSFSGLITSSSEMFETSLEINLLPKERVDMLPHIPRKPEYSRNQLLLWRRLGREGVVQADLDLTSSPLPAQRVPASCC